MNFDTLTLISLKLDDTDLLSLAFTNKYFYERIYNRDRIWLIKLKNYDTTDFEDLNLKPRELYNLIKGLTIIKKAFKLCISLWELYNSSKIDLYNRQIREIPKEIGYLYNLQELYLSYNKIKKIPDTLPNSLEYLDLSGNQIENIPDTLPNSLEYLDLSGNQIENIPDTLPNSLEYLDLSGNQIENIPDTLPSSLQKLWSNRLDKIPEKYRNIVHFYT